MRADFSSFVGAWALLLSCVVLVVEPIAPGVQWFNRALRLATGIAGLATFLLARSLWHQYQATPPQELAALPPGWDMFKPLTEIFFIVWTFAVATIVPAAAPCTLYRRVTRPLAVGPVLLTWTAAITVTLTAGNYEWNPVAVNLLAGAVISSMVFWARWAVQRKLDRWRKQTRFISFG